MKKKQYTFSDFCKHSIEHTKKNGSFMTELFVIGEASNLVMAFGDMPQEFESKIKMFMGAGMKVATESMIGNLKGLYFGTEGWMLKLGKDENWDGKGYIKDDPRRIEVLLCTEKNLEDGSTTTISYEMKRDNKGKLIDLKTIVGSKKKDVEKAKSPLLEAFAYGYARATGMKTLH